MLSSLQPRPATKHPSTTPPGLVADSSAPGGHPSFTDLPAGRTTRKATSSGDMLAEKAIQQRLEQLRGQFLQWGTPDLQAFVITKDELRGWIRALEWVLSPRA